MQREGCAILFAPEAHSSFPSADVIECHRPRLAPCQCLPMAARSVASFPFGLKSKVPAVVPRGDYVCEQQPVVLRGNFSTVDASA